MVCSSSKIQLVSLASFLVMVHCCPLWVVFLALDLILRPFNFASEEILFQIQNSLCLQVDNFSTILICAKLDSTGSVTLWLSEYT